MKKSRNWTVTANDRFGEIDSSPDLAANGRYRAQSCHPIEFFEGPLPRPKQQVSCKSLGVTEQTLKKYIKAEGVGVD